MMMMMTSRGCGVCAVRLRVVIPNILPPKSASAAVETGVGCQVQHEPMTRG
jgi:hypothetical protein